MAGVETRRPEMELSLLRLLLAAFALVLPVYGCALLVVMNSSTVTSLQLLRRGGLHAWQAWRGAASRHQSVSESLPSAAGRAGTETAA
jgi:hypothetical protein